MNSTGAPLLPKLRGYIAEFLTNCSLERLWIFSSSTCVGLRYGSLPFSLEVFLGSVNSVRFSHAAYSSASDRLDISADLPAETGLHALHRIAITGGTYPSASPHRDNEQLGVPEY